MHIIVCPRLDAHLPDLTPEYYRVYISKLVSDKNLNSDIFYLLQLPNNGNILPFYVLNSNKKPVDFTICGKPYAS